MRLDPTVWSIAPGHALRLTLTTQPEAAQCANLLANAAPCAPTTLQQQSLAGGVYTILRGATYHSSLNLPLLPYRPFRPVASGPTPTSAGVPLPQALVGGVGSR